MHKPHVICHMTTSLDGKVTGTFLYDPACAAATEYYYEIHRNFRADGFACGRVTMEESFTGGWYPDLSEYKPVLLDMDYMSEDLFSFHAVAFDPHGRLGWKSNVIFDDDPGYHGARVIEVLTRQVDRRYLHYLQTMDIPYLFAGDTQLDVEEALFKLKSYFGIETLLLEGGSILNGAFQRAGVIDELSLVVAPLVAEEDSKPLFSDSVQETYRLKDTQAKYGAVWLRYQK